MGKKKDIFTRFNFNLTENKPLDIGQALAIPERLIGQSESLSKDNAEAQLRYFDFPIVTSDKVPDCPKCVGKGMVFVLGNAAGCLQCDWRDLLPEGWDK